MMKNLILIFSLILPIISFADCYDDISHEASFSSRIFKVESDEMEEYDELDEGKALEVVALLVKRETKCELKDILTENDKVVCVDLPRSRHTCEVPTSIGYFLVHRSSFGSFDHSIIWTRWD